MHARQRIQSSVPVGSLIRAKSERLPRRNALAARSELSSEVYVPMLSSGIGVHRSGVVQIGLFVAAAWWVQGSALGLAAEAEGEPAVARSEAPAAEVREIVPPGRPRAFGSGGWSGAVAGGHRPAPFVKAVDNPFVRAWRDRLIETPPRLLDAYLARPEGWRESLLPILDAHEVPPEFLYLALIESGMDADAVSPASAVGLWQFRDATAREYGLVVEDHLDERTDELRATAAASRYLRDLYERFGSWELAAAAYNAGPGRVQRALEASGADTYWELLERGLLPGETRAYVPRFLAVVQLAAERSDGKTFAAMPSPLVADD